MGTEKYYFLIFALFLILISFTPLAIAQSLLEINLSQEVYFEGDIIVISGQVTPIVEGDVTLQLIRLGENGEESIVENAQIQVAQDGTFSHTVHATGKQWSEEGEYVVRAFYGVDSVADAFFDFIKKDQEASLIFEVEKPDQSGTFDIEYIIRGGIVTDIIVDQEAFELIVLIEPKSDGAITLKLPRIAIDAKKSDGTDDIFIILIDGVEVPFTETQNDANTRTIIIEFEKTDSDIEIIGTNILKPLPISTSSGLSSIGVFADSAFRIVPDKPNVGSIIRVTGNNFGENVKLEFFIENSKLETFSTNEDGFFMITTQIPKGNAGRVDFIVKDSQGNEKTISVRLGGEEKRVVEEDVKLTITSLPLTINPGDVLLISGTGSPGGTITAEIIDSDGNTITSEAASVSQQGKWSFETIISLNTPLGKYSAKISDGKDTILKSWTVESITTQKTTEQISEPVIADDPYKGKIALFVDPEKDPQHYVDRYTNEPEYKKWFDENFPQYSSIYEAVGLPEPDEEKLPDWVRNIFIWYAEGQIGESDLLSALEFLINEGIIQVKT